MPSFALPALCLAAGLALLCLGGGYALYRFAVVRPRRAPAAPDPVRASNEALRIRAACNVAGRTFARSWGWQDVHIQSADGLRLAGRFFAAKSPTRRTAVAIHGYHSTGLYEYAGYAPMFLETLGMNLLLVDNRAHGGSEGTRIGFGYLDRMDILAWLRWTVDTLGEDTEILLQGVSMGAAAVLMAAAESGLPRQVRWLVADCAFTSMAAQLQHLMRNRYHVPRFPLYHTANLFCWLLAGYSFNQPNALAAAAGIHLPTLFVHGSADTYVPAAMAAQLFAACPAEHKQLRMVKGAVHAQSYAAYPEGYAWALTELLAK